MSLEEALKANTAALEANTAALLGKGGASKPASGKPASGKPATSKKNAEVTVDDVAEKFGGYLNTGSASAKKKAKQVVKGIVDHFGAERITKIDPDEFGKALSLLEQYQEGEDPLDLFDGDGEGDDGGMV